MTEFQAYILIAVLFFLVSSQYKDDTKIWTAWWFAGCLFIGIAAGHGIMGMFA